MHNFLLEVNERNVSVNHKFITKWKLGEFGYSWHHWAYKRYGCITGDNAGFFHIDGDLSKCVFNIFYNYSCLKLLMSKVAPNVREAWRNASTQRLCWSIQGYLVTPDSPKNILLSEEFLKAMISDNFSGRFLLQLLAEATTFTMTSIQKRRWVFKWDVF